jgi:hypothetical protein
MSHIAKITPESVVGALNKFGGEDRKRLLLAYHAACLEANCPKSDALTQQIAAIYRANSAANKKHHIESILERIQAIQLMMRLCHDMRILARSHYAALSEMTDILGRQAQGWLKSSGRGGVGTGSSQGLIW